MPKAAASGRTKKEKDPNAPKRPLSAYFLWTAEERPKIRAEQPELKVTEIAKILGERWKSVGDKDKKRFEEAAAKDKVRYETEKEAYTPSEVVEKKSSKKAEKSEEKAEKKTKKSKKDE